MTTSLATTPRPGGLAQVRPGTALAAFSPEDREILVNSICPGASAEEVNYFLAVSGALGMNPLTREIHLLITESSYKGKVTRKVNVHAGIDGLRKRAMSSGRIRGIVGPEWSNEKGTWFSAIPAGQEVWAARATVYLEGFDFPIQVVVYWDEFGAHNAKYWTDEKTGDVRPTNNWSKMPRHMLGKVALSHALRSACPDLLAGVYSTDEIGAEDYSSGMSVVVNEPAEQKRARVVARPGNAPAPPVSVQAPPEPDIVDGEIVDQSSDASADECAEAVARIKSLFPQVFPGDGDGGVAWDTVLAYCANVDGADGKLGRKYPMLKEWNASQLTSLEAALSDDWARRQLEPEQPAEQQQAEESAPEKPSVSREEYEDQQAQASGLGDPEKDEASF